MATDPISIGRPFKRIAIDIVGPMTVTRRGNNSIVVITDYFTKWPEAFACFNPNAATVAKLLFDNVCTRFGYPNELISDRGGQFTGEVAKSLQKLFKIRKLTTTSYNPQADGQVERLNHTLAEMLAMYVKEDQTDWDSYLPQALQAYRTTVHKSTKETPFFLMFGRRYRDPLDATINDRNDLNIDQYKTKLVETMKKSKKLALLAMNHAKQSAERNYNKSKRDLEFKKGDEVMVHIAVPTPASTKKLQDKWKGPFTITRVINRNAYQLNFEPTSKFHNVVSIRYLKPYYERPLRLKTNQQLGITNSGELPINPQETKNNTTRVPPTELAKESSLTKPFTTTASDSPTKRTDSILEQLKRVPITTATPLEEVTPANKKFTPTKPQNKPKRKIIIKRKVTRHNIQQNQANVKRVNQPPKSPPEFSNSPKTMVNEPIDPTYLPIERRDIKTGLQLSRNDVTTPAAHNEQQQPTNKGEKQKFDEENEEMIENSETTDAYLPPRDEDIPQIHAKERTSKRINHRRDAMYTKQLDECDLLHTNLSDIYDKLEHAKGRKQLAAFKISLYELIHAYIRNSSYRKNLNKTVRMCKDATALRRVLQRWIEDFTDKFANRIRKY
jgi:hypothetical protein